MDWLKKLPVIGPAVARLMETHVWRSYETLDRVHWTRLAAAITFTSFLSLFPLIAVGAAVGAALLSPKQLDTIEKKLSEQVPGISDQLGISNLVEHAGTVGLVAGALLLFTGIGWIGSMRDCLRAVWGKDDEDTGNPVVRKLKDAGLLLGLGGAALLTLVASTVGSTAVGWTADRIGIPEDGAGGVLLQAAALAVAVGADFLLLLYMLTLLPGVEPPRRRLVVAALVGAVGFELLKLLLGSYMKGVASKSMYGAFGVPIALLLWINFTAKLLLVCAAWTATRSKGEAPQDGTSGAADGDGDERAGDGAAGGGTAGEERGAAAPAASRPAGSTRAAKGGGRPVSGGAGGGPGREAASAG
ncbi:YihY/virulence factor BrkB family protein [uncultured Streptomyces sp.]|uniref:YihY/virulence factor BrkB family protein n=1 Tax=uncultured Streptomyces sp. TaxID=174707 RepID=UPI002614C479|nr:YihY/virulence factor BrkB family protein [uncultured Streptomyces sp.]